MLGSDRGGDAAAFEGVTHFEQLFADALQPKR